MKNDELLHKWINNTISEKELELFKARPEYNSLVNLYKQTEHLSVPKIDTESMLSSILQTDQKTQTLAAPAEESKKTIIPMWAKIAVAACLLLVAGNFLFNNSVPINIQNSGMANLEEQLPNGSMVTLYPKSVIEYDESTWGNKREVKMEGKAKFKVVKGNPFVVNSSKGNVEVLGTEFLVDIQEDHFSVNCFEGKVQVSSSITNASSNLLKEESFIVYDYGASILRKQNATSLKTIDLKMVLAEIENVFNITIDSQSIDTNQTLTSSFKHDNLENALKTITIPLKLDYEIDGTSVSIKNS